MKHNSNKNYIALKAPEQCVVDEAMKQTFKVTWEKEDKSIMRIREDIASDRSEVDRLVKEAKDNNSDAKRNHGRPVSKCVP